MAPVFGMGQYSWEKCRLCYMLEHNWSGSCQTCRTGCYHAVLVRYNYAYSWENASNSRIL